MAEVDRGIEEGGVLKGERRMEGSREMKGSLKVMSRRTEDGGAGDRKG